MSRAASNGHRGGRVDSASQNTDQPVEEGLLVMNRRVARRANFAQFVGAVSDEASEPMVFSLIINDRAGWRAGPDRVRVFIATRHD